MIKNEFKAEWLLLQSQYDSYEKHSLYIKLLSVTLLLVAEISNSVNFFMLCILIILWLQDSIWKTFQARIESRLIRIEKCILEESTEGVFQFNNDYQRDRLRGLSLINEYIRQAIRPTVAFPHISLAIIILIQLSFNI
jgi:hypothetical protein